MRQVEGTKNPAPVAHPVKTILEKAKQGNPKALEQLMSGPLKQKGIDVAVERKGALVFITLAGKKCPPRQGSLTYIRQGLEKLGVSGIDSVRLSGYQTGQISPQWVERLCLRAQGGAPQLQQSPAVYQPATGSAPQPAAALRRALLILLGLILFLSALGLALRLIQGQSSESAAPAPAEFFVQPESPANEGD